ncbi:universal stress protein [Micromonospora craniellae]|uniref:Universal stress protein n=1 Tax=Micromonospora craniellae TaxID=2294034 RepID=A0A372G1M6_9ACTN|nr:universal stress protein [Micromonospora craniellae]QOC95352.1 universal stress protein [Micromonospora craniellae]RFS46794.1 universal stress protein [Micromonospora craniellae]
MDPINGAAVVVGVDGSEPARAAIRLAATEAARQELPLRVRHAFIWPLLHTPISAVTDDRPGNGLREQAEQVVAAAVDEAATVAPGLRVTGEIVDGEAAAALIDAAPTAAMIVLGHQGLGGLGALVVGSVTVKVAASAGCPVLVARGTAHVDGPVVVGVDGSETSRHAIEFAVRTAALRGTSVVATHAYRHPASSGPGDMQPLVYDESELRAEEDRLLAEALAGLAERYPEVPVTRESVRGRAGTVLTDASRRAQLLVVGGAGRGEVQGLLRGSVSQSALRHSHCPVAVVRAPGVGGGPGG